MLKRTVLFLISLCLSLSCACAIALTCPEHPYAEAEYESLSGYWYEYSPSQHSFCEGHWFCPVCFRNLKDVYTYDRHRFSSSTTNGGSCTVCGYHRPTRQENIAAAEAVLYDLPQRGGWAMYQDSVYRSAGYESANGTLAIGSYYRAVSYAYRNGELWIEVAENIDIQHPIGWIHAGSIAIEQGAIAQYDTASYVGLHVTVIVSSGRIRSGAGNYPVVGYVHKGDKYTVYEAAYGTDGKIWFRIHPSQQQWISAGLTGIK